MKTLDDVVRATIQEFVKDGLLFTGLDVSNKVKETLPFARHSEVSELVRLSFVTEIEPSAYAKTPISVTLRDGSQRTAMLYHPLADSWDLDNKYDSQKRSQVTVSPTAAVPATVNANGTVTVKPTFPGLPTPVTAHPMPKIVPATPVAATPARDLWANLFNSQPSLFPRK